MVKCPNCGQQAEGNYCRWCGYPIMAGDSKGSEKSGAGGENLNWFQRHLNWTWFLASFVGVILLGFVIGLIVGYLDPYAHYISDAALDGIGYSISILVSLIVGGWVLRRKDRSLWWLLILFVPFGWIVFLCLENRSYLPRLAK